MMKNIFLLFLLNILISTLNLQAQSPAVDLPAGDISIEEIFSKIEEQTNFKFFYRPDQLDVNRKVTLSTRDKTVEKVVYKILLGSNLRYQIMEDNLIVIMPTIEKRRVRGKVLSETGVLLPGANIIIKGTLQGTTTDTSGYFEIDIPVEKDIIHISYIGYFPLDLSVKDKNDLLITLTPNLADLEEVVVIGYETRKKSLVSGSISRLNNKEVIITAPTRAEQSLQGQTSGVTIIQNSGSPGAGVSVRVRGTGSNNISEPLYIVDGMRVYGLDFIDPSDIESIEVLKDAASAAIYGAEGANGVILVTSKTGKKGSLVVNYDYYFGMQQISHKMEMLNSFEYATYKKEAIYYEIDQRMRHAAGGDTLTTDYILQSQINSFRESGIPDPDSLNDQVGTNWLNELYQWAPITKHHFSFSGGNENNVFLSSFSYYSQDGIIGGEGTNFTRYSARLNSEHTINKWFSANTNFVYSNIKRNLITENQEYGGLVSNAIFIDPLTPTHYSSIDEIPQDVYDAMLNKLYKGDILKLESSKSLKDNEGYFGYSELVKAEIANPIYQLYNNHNSYKQDRIIGGLGLEIRPFKGLKYNSDLTADIDYSEYSSWRPSMLWNIENLLNQSTVSDQIIRNLTMQWENYIAYSATYRKHSISALVGNTNRQTERHYLSGIGENMVYEGESFAHLSSTLNDTLSRAASGWTQSPIRLLSYFGRISYNYSEKYQADFVVRSDASSLLSPNHREGYFPSVSVGWVVSKENFWIFKFINFYKLRLSWGQNGSLSNLSPFQYVSTITNIISGGQGTTGNLFSLDANGSLVPGAQPSALSNPDLGWETSVQTDFGFDMGLLNNKILFTFDIYRKTTKDLLAQGGVPVYAGNNPPYINAGEVRNSGVELEASYRFKIGGVNSSFSANAAYLKNKVISYTKNGGELNGAGIFGEGSLTKFSPGFPAWYFNTYQTDGIFQNWTEIDNYKSSHGNLIQPNAIPGDFKIVDQNGDGNLNDADKKYSGSPWPDCIFGFTSNFEYKGFDLAVFINGSVGNELYNGFHRSDVSNGNILKTYYDNRWTPENPTNDYFRASYSNTSNFSQLDFYVEDGSWVKLKTVTLGYTLPEKIMYITPFKVFRVYFSGQNLWLFTRYNGFDPEIGNTTLTSQASLSSSSVGIDRGFYPSSRIYIVGFNVSF